MEKRLVENYPTRAWQVQYGETDFDFIQRLMQEWGIYWWFEHNENSHTLVLADAINVHKACADSPLVCYYQKGLKLDKEFIHTITANESLRSGQWVLTVTFNQLLVHVDLSTTIATRGGSNSTGIDQAAAIMLRRWDCSSKLVIMTVGP